MANFATAARFCGLLLFLATLTAMGPRLHGQQASSVDAAWDELIAAPAGSKVQLTLAGGSLVKGRLVAAGTDTVVVDEIETGKTGIATQANWWEGSRLTLPRTTIGSIAIVKRARVEAGPRAGSFEQLGLLVGPGERVIITDRLGSRIAATIASLSSSQLSGRVGGELRQWQEGEVVAIQQRRSDSLANGAKWGMAIGAGVGFLPCGRCHVGPGLMMAAIGAGVGAGIGVGIDALIKSDFVIFQRRDSKARVTIAPQLSKSHKGVTVSIGF